MGNNVSTPIKTLFKSFLMRGILVGLPIIITVYIVVIIIKFFDNLIWNVLLPKIYSNKIVVLDVLSHVPGLGVIISILIIITIGVIASNVLGKYFIKIGDTILHRIPFVKSVYSITKQIFDTILSANSNAFKEAVLVEFPQKGSWTIGFVTSRTSKQITSIIQEVDRFNDEEYVNVLVPTAPPTAGYLLIVKKSEVRYMKGIKVDQVMKFLISGGVLSIEDAKKAIEKEKK